MSYHVYWHFDGRRQWELNCSESKAYAKWYSLSYHAQRIMVHDQKVIESGGPSGWANYKYMCAGEACNDGKLDMPKHNKYHVVYEWDGFQREEFDDRDDAMIVYGSIPSGKSKAVTYQGEVLRNDGPNEDCRRAIVGWTCKNLL